MNDFEIISHKFTMLLGELKAIQEQISNSSDPNTTINTNSTITLREDEQRILQELQSTFILVTNYKIHRDAELRSLTLPILADQGCSRAFI